MAKLDPQVAAHLEWIGFVRPTGLVVSAPALVRAGVILNRRDAEGQRLLRECVEDHGVGHDPAAPGPRLSDFRAFAESVLGWSFSPKGYAGTADAPIPDQLEVQLPEGGGAFRPDFAVRAEPLRSTSPRPVPAAATVPDSADDADRSAVGGVADMTRQSDTGAAGMTRQSDTGAAGGTKDEPSPWQLLVSVIDTGESFYGTTAGGLELSAHGRMERLLRHTRAPAGLIFNGTALRLVSAPSGENSGWLDFRVADMLQTAGRPICAAMRELLGQTRLLAVPADQERRRSGSHYTPRELTEPIVRIALEPILDRLKSEAAAPPPPRPEQILDLKVCDPAMGSGAFLVEACRQLADLLIESWRAHGIVPEIPPDEDETIFARRMVAQRCLYGVDRNPKAVDLAKLSLWLTTLAREHPLTFLDHALRHGDSLVGLSIPQLQAFHWKGDAPHFEEGFESLQGRAHLDEAAELRQLIREADDSVSDGELRELWDQAQSETAAVRLLGDLALAAFFQESKPREREARRKEFAAKVIDGEADTYRSWLNDLRDADPPLAPFHWQIEFPEVFGRDNPGFDTIVGNPPFAGKNTIASSNIENYPVWLKQVHVETHGAADLAAHFFRRAFDLIRHKGTFGLIATNTIAQGDTRYSGLRWICTKEGKIYCARRRFKWPGVAAVVVSIVHVHKGQIDSPRSLDGRTVEAISAFLFHGDDHEDPPRLIANSGQSFQGDILRGMGFTFHDDENRGVATPLSEMKRLLERSASNGEVIFPYIGGREVNSSPYHSHHRYVIDLNSYSLPECYERWPEITKIVEEGVKPERDRLGDSAVDTADKDRWWCYSAYRQELREAVENIDRVLVNSQVSHRVQFAFLPSDMVYSHALNVYPLAHDAAFCAVQSRPHEVWAHFFGSSMKDDLRYTPSDCFETFPFPEDWETRLDLEMVGKEYYKFRAALMVRNDEGMTKTYNRFHDPYENEADIEELRRLHASMDRAVLDAYGWSDIPTDCEFLLDYEIDEETWGNKTKPYRYRWPDDVRDEVLARLLELNAERAAEEARVGLTKPKREGKPRGGRPRRVSAKAFPPSATLWDTPR